MGRAIALLSCGFWFAFAAERFVPDLAPARAAVEAGDFAVAEEQLLVVIAAAQQARAPVGLLAYPLKTEGDRYVTAKQPERAEWLLSKVVKIWEAEFGPSHNQVAFGLLELANVLKRQDKIEEAQQVLQRAAQILGDHPAAALTAPRGPSQTVFRVGGGSPPVPISPGVSRPVLIYKVEPVYSDEARRLRFGGTVVVNVEVDETGRAQNVRVVRWVGLGLDEQAVEAVRQWRFKPGMRDDKPVVTASYVEVNFRLL